METIGWLGAWRRYRLRGQAAAAELESEARRLIDTLGRGGTLLELDARREAAHDREAREKIDRLRLAIDRLSPRAARPDTATRMLFRDP